VAGASTKDILRPTSRSGRGAIAPLPEDDGRKPGDQQAWTSEQRHTLTRHVDERARDALKAYDTPEETDPLTSRQSALRGSEGGS